VAQPVRQFLDSAETAGDPQQRAQSFRLAENQLLRDLPIAPLWTEHGHAVWSERIRDVTTTPGWGLDLTTISA
jgi:oligopeptide transport system substrate-binding protein